MIYIWCFSGQLPTIFLFLSETAKNLLTERHKMRYNMRRMSPRLSMM